MRVTSLFNRLLGLQGLRVQTVRFTDRLLVLGVRRRFRLLRCPRCGRRRRGRESTSIRRWRHLAVWGLEVVLEGEVRRLHCRACDAVVTEDVPWARHGSDFTKPFEDAVALLAQQTNRTAVAELTGVAWTTVGNIAARVVEEHLDSRRFETLRRIGVDEISFRKRHKYLTVVTDHDTRRVVWVAEGKSSDVLGGFFRSLGADACAKIEIVTIDMSAAFERAVREHLPNAEIAFDHFHVAKLANEALNEVRRELQRNADDDAAAIKGTRWPLLHSMANLPDKHAPVVAALKPEEPLGRAYLLKESLLDLLRSSGAGEGELRAWIGWASRSRLAPFVKLGRTLRTHFEGVATFVRERFANGLAEGMNNKIRLLSHRAYGFHSAPPLIATIYLCCAGITLPHLQLL